MADNVAITAGSGTTIATDDVGGGVHVQRVKNTYGVDGTATDVSRTAPMPVTQGIDPTLTYYFRVANQVHVAAASTVHFDLWNADATLLVRVLTIRQIPDIVTAVTGVATTWRLARTTSVGTGGSAQTAWLPDTSQTALDADITCRSKATGGAAEGTDLYDYALSSEETNAATIQIASWGGLELVPLPLIQSGEGILLRPSQGIGVWQKTSSSAGNTGWLIGFSVE
jgi:hypothetical protein